MKSDDKEISGLISLSFRIFDLYSITVWPRFIEPRILSEPLCTGRCTCETSSGTSA